MVVQLIPEPEWRGAKSMSVRHIRDVLRGDILSGHHEPGGRLPSEQELTASSGQEDALLPWRNVELALQVPAVGSAVRRNRSRTLPAEVGLDGCEDHLPGRRQRVQLANPLAMEHCAC